MSGGNFAAARASGLVIDDSRCESTHGTTFSPPELGLPINGRAVLSLAGDGLFGGVVTLEDGRVVGTLAIGHSGCGAWHVALTPDEARTAASGLMRLAIELGGTTQ